MSWKLRDIHVSIIIGSTVPLNGLRGWPALRYVRSWPLLGRKAGPTMAGPRPANLAQGGGGMISDGPPESVRVGPARLRRWMARPRDGDRRERTAWVRRPPGEGRFRTSGTAQAGGFLCFLLYLVPLSRPCHQAGKDAFSLVDRTSLAIHLRQERDSFTE